MFDSRYEAQAALLLRCLPDISRQEYFALKGGTAINLFRRDLPRISVDIDLAYLPAKSRQESLQDIQDALRSIKNEIKKHIPASRIQEQSIENYVRKLFVATEEAIIKIEPNTIFRGFVYEPEELDLCPAAQSHFQSFVRIKTMSMADLYGSKICAALDRQHPRDLFDVKLLLAREGITPEIRKTFIVYLAGHSRPMSELLSPRLIDIEQTYENHFKGMARDEGSLEDLLKIQRTLPQAILRQLEVNEKEFLISLKRGEPEWGRLGIDHLNRLPALQWKLRNVRKMNSAENKKSLERLIKILK